MRNMVHIYAFIYIYRYIYTYMYNSDGLRGYVFITVIVSVIF